MTILLPDARRGLPPTLEVAPSDGVALNSEVEQDILDVLDWAKLYLDDWQESLLFDALRQNPAGKWAAFEVAGVIPRQNGKGAVMEARQLAGLFVLGERLQLHTAHEFKTCVEHFLRVKALVEGSDELFEQVKIIRTGAGDQAIELHTGQRLRFLARSRSSGRGFSADTVYFDEAFELPVATVGAVLPALSARPNPQVWYFSSAPHYTSDYLHALLRRADVGKEGRLLLRAWENDQETRWDDVEAWRRANPAWGHRITEEFTRDEMEALVSTDGGVAEFRRERLGIREGGDGESGVVPFDAWQDSADLDTKAAGPVCYGLSVSADAQWAAVGSAGRRADGRLHVTKVECRRATDWVIDFVSDLYRRKRVPIRVNPTGGEGAFIRPLHDVDVEVIEVPAREYMQACGEFLDAVKNDRLRYLPSEVLGNAVAAAGRRDVGHEGGWVWAQPGAVDITALKAVTLALSGVATARKRAIENVW